MLAWQTEHLQELALDTHTPPPTGEGRPTDRVMKVRPELVVEIALDGIQESTRYPAGMALRFARVKGYRPDKNPEDADTLESVRALFDRGRA